MTLFKPRHLLLLLAVILAGALAAVVASRYRPSVELAEIVKALPSGVELALQDINYTHSEGGVARWRLVAKQVQLLSAEQVSVVNDLQLTFFGADGVEQATLTARDGRVSADFSVVEVRGEVKIVSRNGYTLQTEYLTYRQQDRSIRTDAPVKLVSARMQLDGVGLLLDFTTRRLRILDKVRAVLSPQPPGQESP